MAPQGWARHELLVLPPTKSFWKCVIAMHVFSVIVILTAFVLSHKHSLKITETTLEEKKMQVTNISQSCFYNRMVCCAGC